MEPILVTKDNHSEYSIWDLVLPLPGYDITLPGGDIGQRYHDLLTADNLTLPGLKHKVR